MDFSLSGHAAGPEDGVESVVVFLHGLGSNGDDLMALAPYFAKELNIPEQAILVRKEIYHAYPEQVLNIIRNLDDSYNLVFLFGHNPCFTSLANQFSKEYIPNVPTCGIVKVAADVNSWSRFEDEGSVEAFYYPKQYF